MLSEPVGEGKGHFSHVLEWSHPVWWQLDDIWEVLFAVEASPSPLFAALSAHERKVMAEVRVGAHALRHHVASLLAFVWFIDVNNAGKFERHHMCMRCCNIRGQLSVIFVECEYGMFRRCAAQWHVQVRCCQTLGLLPAI